MPDLFTDEYEKAKTKWERSRELYDEAVRLYEGIYLLLKHQQQELEIASKEFSIQQSLVIKNAKNPRSLNIKSIKKGE
jgi:hypothetical protein